MATAHFTDAELGCRHCGALPPLAFQESLEELRVDYGKPMRLSSAYRCPEHNQRVSNTGPDGPHVLGAVDVLVYGQDAWDLLRVALLSGWTGIGVRQHGPKETRFLHLDEQLGSTRPWVWSYP